MSTKLGQLECGQLQHKSGKDQGQVTGSGMQSTNRLVAL